MSKYEPLKATISIKRHLWWSFVLKNPIKINCKMVDDIEFVDWMEKHIGKCGLDWDWNVETISFRFIPYYVIKLRKKKQHLSSVILLRWT